MVMWVLEKLVARKFLNPNTKQLVATAEGQIHVMVSPRVPGLTHSKPALKTGCSASHASPATEQGFGRCISHFFMTQSYQNVKGQQFSKPQQNSCSLIQLHSETVSFVRLPSEFRRRLIYIIAFERDFAEPGNLCTQEHALTNAFLVHFSEETNIDSCSFYH